MPSPGHQAYQKFIRVWIEKQGVVCQNTIEPSRGPDIDKYEGHTSSMIPDHGRWTFCHHWRAYDV